MSHPDPQHDPERDDDSNWQEEREYWFSVFAIEPHPEPHKREGYGEMMAERADIERKRIREEGK